MVSEGNHVAAYSISLRLRRKSPPDCARYLHPRVTESHSRHLLRQLRAVSSSSVGTAVAHSHGSIVPSFLPSSGVRPRSAMEEARNDGRNDALRRMRGMSMSRRIIRLETDSSSSGGRTVKGVLVF